MRPSSVLFVLNLVFPLAFALSSSNTAQVYFLPPNPAEHHQPPSVDAFEANTLIAHHLGFDQYQSIGDRVQGWWDELASLVYGSHSGHGIGEGAKDSVMIVVQSDHPEDFIPGSMRPSLVIPSSPPASMYTDLIHSYTEMAHMFFDSVFSSLSRLADSIKSSSEYKSLLDIFDVSGKAASMFIDEFSALVDRIIDVEPTESSPKDKNDFSAFEVKSLAQLEKENGRGSEQYQTAAQSIQAVLSNPALQNRQVAIIVVPPESSLKPPLKRRFTAEAEQSLSASSNKVVFSVSTCFTSNDTCADSTDSCSGHGTCNAVTIAGKTCYTCSCSITKNDQGRRQWWAGQACEKLDLSVPFTLLAGTAIVLIILAIFSASLLLGVGSEPLPSTLAAGAVAHTKRD